jgi:hypothetical protein
VCLRESRWIRIGYVGLRAVNSPAQRASTSSNCTLTCPYNILLHTRALLGKMVRDCFTLGEIMFCHIRTGLCNRPLGNFLRIFFGSRADFDRIAYYCRLICQIKFAQQTTSHHHTHLPWFTDWTRRTAIFPYFSVLPSYCNVKFRNFQSFRFLENVHSFATFPSSYYLSLRKINSVNLIRRGF